MRNFRPHHRDQFIAGPLNKCKILGLKAILKLLHLLLLLLPLVLILIPHQREESTNLDTFALWNDAFGKIKPDTMSPLLVSSLLLLLFRDVFALPDQTNLFRSDEYDHGEFGVWPVHNYRSTDIQGPLLNYWSQSRACDDGKYTLLTPRGASVNQSGPTILDGEGNLVWFKEYGTTYNANVYQFRNESYLTFWAGKDAFGGRGDGTLYMVRPLDRSQWKMY